VGTYEAEKLVGEPAHFSWAGLVANAAGSVAAAEFGPTQSERKAGITSGTLAEKIEANAVQDVVTRETSVALGDNHVQSWQQIAEDVFGNALGNAAIAGIEHENQLAAEKQDNNNLLRYGLKSDGSTSFSDRLESDFSDGSSFLNNLYGSGISDQALADYENSGLPMLASSDAAATHAGVDGAQGGVDVATPSFLADSTQGAAGQIAYDAKWMAYAHGMQQQQGGIANAASVQAAQDAYNAAVGSDTASNGGQYDPEKVQELNDALDEMIQQNGWSFGPLQDVASDQITTLPAISVTGTATPDSSSSSYGMLSYAAATSGTGDSGALGDFATGFSLAGTAADAGYLASKSLGKTWGVSVDWTNPVGYDDVLINNGGKLPSWLAAPKTKVNISSGTGALRDADYVVDLSKLSKVTPWLERGGKAFGWLGVVAEGADGAYHRDYAEVGHAVVNAGFLVGSGLVFGPLAPVVDVGWGVLDESVQHYSYQGRTGWTALGNSAWDKNTQFWHAVWNSQDQMQQQDPTFYQQLWTQPKE